MGNLPVMPVRGFSAQDLGRNILLEMGHAI